MEKRLIFFFYFIYFYLHFLLNIRIMERF